MTDDWARAACIAICSSWRGISIGLHVVSGQQQGQTPVQSQGQMQAPPNPVIVSPLVGVAHVRGTIVLPQRILAEAVIGGEDVWWVESAGGASSGSKVEWTGNAQNNVLTPFHLGDQAIMGSSVWEPLTTGVFGALRNALVSGVGKDDTPLRRTELQAILLAAKCTFVDAELLIDPSEATALKACRKQESATRRRLAPSLASYPWLQ